MKLKNWLLIVLTSASVSVFAQDNTEVDLDDVTMDVADQKDKKFLGHRVRFPAREIVLDYMLENGDITQDEIDAIRAERKDLRRQLRAARDAGDQDTIDSLKDQLAAMRSARRETFEAYLEENEELRTELKEFRENRQENRQEFRERMRERWQERRDETQQESE